MNEQIARGLPPIDDEYRGPCWWHLSRLVDVTRRPGMRRIALVGLSVNAVAVVTGIMEVVWGWSALPIRVGPFELAVTIYPPFILSLLAAVWLGPTWGLVPAYTANLAGALVSGLDPVPAVLFALAGALEVLIFWGAMVTLNIDPDLKRRPDFVRFVGVSIIAPTTASLAILIRNSAQGLSLADGRLLWMGWVIGDVLQALLVVVPLLYFTGPSVRAWIDRQFATPPRYEVTYTRAAIIAATTFALIAMLTFLGIYMLEDSLDLDPLTLTRSGELLLPRLRDMEFFVVMLVVVLTLTTGLFSTVLGRMGERQRGLSRRESLTGCFNRRAFYELFPREVERARRLGQGLSLVFLDIDHFKRINDRFGHEVGDRVLQQLAARLQGTVRETDLLFRWGGEEFVILLGHTSAADAPTLAERVRAAVASRPFLDGDYPGPVPVTVSVGTTGTTRYPVDPDGLIARADAACYRAKAAGRNRVEADAA
ncbi:MAG: diguanylate cyclase [Acidobacteria bacterium]|jgi:diguanylate cyclase (GGDEF)-like protein|nr:diguanylate cyclase [Acidobacteriota bacterium]